jgi:hypothetical protein
MTEYDELLEEARAKVDAFSKSTAKEYIPKMYLALRHENPNLKPEDVRERIEKDCCPQMWKKRTLLDALPDEAKDPKKQKAGRLGQKEHNSAALSAAPSNRMREEIIIDAKGHPTENSKPSTTTSIPPADGPSSSEYDDRLKNNELLHFQFSLSFTEVWQYIMSPLYQKSKEDEIWVNGIINKRTGQVITTTLRKLEQIDNQSDIQ